MNEEQIKFINSYYNPAANNEAGYELFISLATTQTVIRVASDNYKFLTKVALGYLLTEPNIYNISINLWGEFVVKYQRLGSGQWQLHFGHGEIRIYSHDMMVGHLKGEAEFMVFTNGKFDPWGNPV